MLEDLLNSFKEKYSNIEIKSEVLDLTYCFEKIDGLYDAPKSYGALPESKVIAYAVKDALLLKKYQKDDEGNLIFTNNKYSIRALDDDIKVMSCLCIQDIRNTSFQEIYDAMKSCNKIQGYKKEHLKKIESVFIENDFSFNPNTDSAFIFAGKADKVYSSLELNRFWLSQIMKKGSNMLDSMSCKEASLMKEVFPVKVLKGDADAIKRRSYMWGKELHTFESEEFLKRKVSAYTSFVENPFWSKVIKVRESFADKQSLGYVGAVDTIGNSTYSLGVGSMLDYFAGLNFEGIVSSRASGFILNLVTGGGYGAWRDKVYSKMSFLKENSEFRKYLSDLISFNTIQVPIYAVALGVGSFVEDRSIDYNKIMDGCEYLVKISPLIGPTMGWYMNKVRKVFHTKTPEEKIQKI